MKIKGILKFWFWISLHQGTLSILYSRIQSYMLSFMNEVDPCLLLPPCVLYEIQNHIFSNTLNLWFGKEYGTKKSPPKLKVFAWRFYVNGLPTIENFSHRGIAYSHFCPICDKAIETTAHALFHCDHAKLTWALWSDCPIDLSRPICDLVDIVLDIIKRGTLHDMEIFFATT